MAVTIVDGMNATRAPAESGDAGLGRGAVRDRRTAASGDCPLIAASRRYRWRRHGENGVTTLEFVLIAPALIALIFAVIQFSLWYYAGEVVRTAATSGAQAGATSNAGTGAARSEATSVLAGPGGGVVQASRVAAAAQDGNVAVTVTGHATSLVFGMTLDVKATSSQPIEQFSPQTQP